MKGVTNWTYGGDWFKTGKIFCFRRWKMTTFDEALQAIKDNGAVNGLERAAAEMMFSENDQEVVLGYLLAEHLNGGSATPIRDAVKLAAGTPDTKRERKLSEAAKARRIKNIYETIRELTVLTLSLPHEKVYKGREYLTGWENLRNDVSLKSLVGEELHAKMLGWGVNWASGVGIMFEEVRSSWELGNLANEEAIYRDMLEQAERLNGEHGEDLKRHAWFNLHGVECRRAYHQAIIDGFKQHKSM
ncbi:hypothetical protein LVJ83_00685 [Uruburuella testudinis]|uniref:Uncharacterized protein n=1 Tax=Uruburuella testudinis TaxID=1282863 RepID=A0ABY4DT13_9NEIS|nr:hypothetical protein [Uruburuella testudinis]UOO82028.1 hypothetical protein LVJ83_00685 [Uruburuella testudinis]